MCFGYSSSSAQLKPPIVSFLNSSSETKDWIKRWQSWFVWDPSPRSMSILILAIWNQIILTLMNFSILSKLGIFRRFCRDSVIFESSEMEILVQFGISEAEQRSTELVLSEFIHELWVVWDMIFSDFASAPKNDLRAQIFFHRGRQCRCSCKLDLQVLPTALERHSQRPLLLEWDARKSRAYKYVWLT